MRRIHKIQGFHVMADGKVLTDEQFFAKPYIVAAEDNYQLAKESNTVFDPNYIQKENLRREYRRAEERRKELELLQEKVSKELEGL